MLNPQHVVESIPFPIESGIKSIYSKPNLKDSFAIELPDNTSTNPEVLARFIFANIPGWSKNLLKVRDAIVGLFGLKTGKQLKKISDKYKNDRVSIFKIYDNNPTEIILGESDKHLDFRLSVLYTTTDGKQRLILSTIVQCHNFWGRLYLFIIAPFHRLIVKSNLRRAAEIGWPKSNVT